MNESNLKKFANFIKDSKKIVFFTGAGISTESGIPDFRSSGGVYSKQFKNLDPVEIVSHDFLFNNPKLFYEFYFKYLVYKDAKPNYGHLFFNELENKDVIVVTQNIDNLHQLGGSKKVYELHGSVERNYCSKCNKKYSLDEIYNSNLSVPYCKVCNQLIRPDVVLFGEQLDYQTISGAIQAISNADLLVVAGTSLSVYPAASFVDYYTKNKFVLINKDITPYDFRANLIFNESVVKVFKAVKKLL